MRSSLKQLTIDFPRKDREGLLKEVELPKGLGVNHQAIAFIMTRIASFHDKPNGCYESAKTLAMRGKMTEQMAERALTALRKLELLSQRDNADWEPNEHRKCVSRWIYFPRLQEMVEQQRSSIRLIEKTAPTIPSDSTDHSLISGLPSPHKSPTIPSETADHSLIIVRDNKKYSKDHHQPETKSAVADDLEILEMEFKSIGLHRFASLAREFQGRVGTVRDAIAVYSRQRHKFNGPGAVVDFLRSGSWPADDILSAEELAPREQLRTATKAPDKREGIRCDVARDWKRIGTWWNASELEINAEIDRRLDRSASVKGVA
jgi:hypothetical protein